MSTTGDKTMLSERLYRLWETNEDPGRDHDLNVAKLHAREMEAERGRMVAALQLCADSLQHVPSCLRNTLGQMELHDEDGRVIMTAEDVADKADTTLSQLKEQFGVSPNHDQ